MKFSEFIKEMIRDFFIIFGSIIIIITILRQFVQPDLPFDLKSIYTIMTFSAIGALTGFIMYSRNDLSEKQMRIRLAIHFFALEIILISLAVFIGIINSTLSAIILALQIAVVYIIVRLLAWQNDKKVSKSINEKLKSFKENN
ncbi:DUF3021 family protein [Paenibacillus sp. L3-i20]|uniref:DUF3021 family protein n=1 Tax=Paenibacillus sp. L3-i20 TaxID=2905833 RepID=UPI001EE08E8B|nr:DUF3021 family protein [Paenibacillus sp. L3-i20]GKU76613.1 hypothetical protein L3i20_v210100 [Paenibacillus sp. L3-i20]